MRMLSADAKRLARQWQLASRARRSAHTSLIVQILIGSDSRRCVADHFTAGNERRLDARKQTVDREARR